MTLVAALTRLATWAPAGVQRNFGDALSAPPVQQDLPGLLVDFGYTAEGVKPLNVGATAGQLVVYVDHLLIVSSIALQLESERLSASATALDNYLAKVVTDMTLNGNLIEPLTIYMTVFGPMNVLGQLYRGWRIKHRWVLKY